MRMYIVDAFTDTPFAGNPAGVVLLDAPADEDWMQSVAAELKHSETAFVEANAPEPHPLRWFTPSTEVDLCGHATLATAHVLGGSRTFETRSGPLTCTATGGGWVEMDFPADPGEPVDADPTLVDALGGVTIEHVERGVSDLLVVASDAAQVRAVRPKATLAELPARGVIVTAPSDVEGSEGSEGSDFVSRCFFPGAGVDEDPVTGSAHCTLAPYWAQRLGKQELVGRQVSERGGTVRMTLSGDRVGLTGQAVTIARGELCV
ncbi:MAG: PhzF family phenazine biosynthesis isomerase [Actinophytocola sp.]|nr:PhzF family phenazine biosynthesis isomerase [Actinophytocola sp.]